MILLLFADGRNIQSQRRFQADHEAVRRLSGADFFPTPAWATQALIDNEKFDGDIWESACGNGAMSEVLEQTGATVISSDLYDRGYGEAGVNFLTSSRCAQNIITNPPYNAAEGFVRSGLQAANRKFAL